MTERRALASTLTDVGPEAPTLDEGWDARDLLVHLLMRERKPAAMLGKLFTAVAGPAEKVEAELRETPFAELVDRFRAGPPRWSPMRLRPLDALMNGTEYLVHHEDVLRAQDPPRTRELTPEQQDEVWKTLKVAARVLFRATPVGLILTTPEHGGLRVKGALSTGSVVLSGRPVELLLYAFGRQDAAEVTLTGSPEARREFEALPLGV